MNHLRITTTELAQLCGVSQGTVDRALNNRSGIRAETKEKVLRVATQYGFRGMIGNEKYRDDKSRQIGIIVFNLNNEYFCRMITEIEAVCRKMGYATMVMFTDYDKQHEIDCIRRMYYLGVEGIILCAVNSGPEFENYLKGFDIPIVAVGNDIKSIPFVGIDDFTAMKETTEYVMQGGYKNIIYFSPAIQYDGAYAQKRRFEGFLAAISPRLAYSVITDINKIKEVYTKDTVIMGSTDYYSLKVYFKTRGARIIGFDNIDVLDKYQIPITSVGYSMAEIAQTAMEIVRGERKEGKMVEYHIIER